MADSNNANKDTNKPNDVSKAGTYSDDLLRLVEEQDKDGNLSYCVECCKSGDLLYSSNSKPQAYSFAEGYRARDNGDDTPKTPKPKGDDNNPPDDKAKPDDKANLQVVDPAKVQRKRAVI
jgi:hypothetical protein